MSLSIGELNGYLGLEDGPFQDGIEGALESLKGFGGKGVVLAAAAGAAIAVALGAAVLKGMDVEKATDKLAAQLGLTEAESERVGGVAGRLYSQAYGESIQDVNTAVGAVISTIQGMRTASDGEVEAMTAKAMNLAEAFDLDVQRAVSSVGIAMKSGLATDANQAFDLITAAMQKMPAHMREELLEATDEYGQFFHSLGFNGEQAFGMLAKASEEGMYGIDKTGDAIKEFTIRATDMSKTSVEAYEAIGLNAGKMSNDILAGGDTAKAAFDKIVSGLLAIEDPTERANEAIKLFGTPIEDLSVSEIPSFLQGLLSMNSTLTNTAGAADAMGKTLNDNAATNFESFKRQLEMIVVGLGANLLPIVNTVAAVLATVLGPAFETVGNFVADNSTAITVIAALIATLMIPRLIVWGVTAAQTAAANTALWVQSQIAATKSAAVQVASWTLMGARAMGTAALYVAAFAMMGASAVASAAKQVAMTVAMGAYAAVTNVVRGATIAWTAVQWLLNAALTANPIGIVIVAIVAFIAAIVLLWNNCETFRNVVTAVWEAIKTAVSAVVDWFTSTVWPTLQTVWNGIATGVSWLWNMYSAYWGLIWSVVKAVIAWIVENVWPKIQTAYTFVTEGLKLLWNAFTTYWGFIWNIIQTIVGWIVEHVVSKFNAAKEGAILIWNALKTAISNAVNNIKNVVSGIGAIVGTVVGFFQRIKDGIVEKFQAVIEFVKGVPGKVVNALGNIGSKLVQAGREIIDGFLRGLRESFEKVKNFVGGIGDWIASHKGPKEYDLALLVPNGGWIMDGLVAGIERKLPALRNTLSGIAGDMEMQFNAPAARLNPNSSSHLNAPVTNQRIYNFEINGAPNIPTERQIVDQFNRWDHHEPIGV